MIRRACSWRVILLSHLLVSNITVCKPIINLYGCRRVDALIMVVVMKRKVLAGIKSRDVEFLANLMIFQYYNRLSASNTSNIIFLVLYNYINIRL